MPRNSVYAPYRSIATQTRARPRAVARESVEPARPSGPAAAVVLAAGLASFALGLFSVLTAASSSVSSALTLSERVGDISGVTTGAAVTFAATWAVLAIAWRRADPPLARVAAAAGVLIALGLLGTFPPFFNAIGG
jgi:hypothetical protein